MDKNQLRTQFIQFIKIDYALQQLCDSVVAHFKALILQTHTFSPHGHTVHLLIFYLD